jgi:hypothetical protein
LVALEGARKKKTGENIQSPDTNENSVEMNEDDKQEI